MKLRQRSALVLAAAVVPLVWSLAATPVLADDASCIAATEQALTLRKQGKLHDALGRLAVCAAVECPAEVKTECASRIAEVDAAMPTLVLAATDRAGNDLRDVKVTADGVDLVANLDGRPISIDPGEHTLRFEATGQPPVEKKLVVREGDKSRRESVVIGSPPPVPPPPVPPTPTPSWWTTQRTLGLIGTGVGVVGLGFGAVFGGLAMSDHSQEKTNCSVGACSNRLQALADYNTASSNATVSTVGFITGGVLLAAGATLLFTARSPTLVPAAGRLYLAPSTTPNGAGLVVGGEL